MRNCRRTLNAAIVLTLMCALLSFSVSAINAFLPLPFAEQLVNKFLEMFTLGMGAIIALLARGGTHDTG